MVGVFLHSVMNIYQVTRAVENINFKSDVGNVCLLSHASRVENFVGILSRFVGVTVVVVVVVVVFVCLLLSLFFWHTTVKNHAVHSW